MSDVGHVRRAGRFRADRRFRFQNDISRKVSNAAGTLCGADPTWRDTDKPTARRLVEQATLLAATRFAATALASVDDICAECRAKLALLDAK